MQRVKEEKSVYDSCLSAVDPEKDIFPQLFMKYSQEDTNALAMNQANIDNIVDQTWAAWMTDSSRDIDAEWDSYVESVKNAGLTQNLEIRQNFYEEKRTYFPEKSNSQRLAAVDYDSSCHVIYSCFLLWADVWPSACIPGL